MRSIVDKPVEGDQHRLATCLKLVCCCVLFAAAVRADTVTLTLNVNFPGDYIFYTYTSVGGSTESDPVAPYDTILTDTDGTYNNTPVFAICYDINNDTNVGTAFTGHFTNDYSSVAVLQATFLGNLLDLDGDRAAPLAVQGAISLAIWQIMYPTSTDSNGHPFLPSDWDPAAQAYVNLAIAVVASGQWNAHDATLYPMWVPDNPGLQRFGIIFEDVPPIVVPEPGALALLSSGLLAMAWLWRRRARALAAQRIAQTRPSLRNTP